MTGTIPFTTTDETGPSNRELSDTLEEIAALLEAQEANPFRVRAYRRAARTVAELRSPVRKIVQEEGIEGLVELPGIGESLARSLEQLCRSRHLGLLERLRGETTPERVLTTVPGIGPQLARRIHEELGIENLHELDIAAYDGRLDSVPGLGRRRIQGIRETLAGRLRREPARAVSTGQTQSRADEPPVEELLDIDREYRSKADAGRLPRIAPRRFNPRGEAWLPILHTHRDDRQYTALFSNTARAHELGTTGDWVVIYRDDHRGHGQWTVVTARLGPWRGQRVVRRARKRDTASALKDQPPRCSHRARFMTAAMKSALPCVYAARSAQSTAS